MRLGWNRGEDGVITVYAHTETGKVFPVADFWLKPMADFFGAGSRPNCKNRQQEFAEFLVAAWNARGRAKILADPEDQECPYFYHDGEKDVPANARSFVEVPPSRDDMTGANGCWLSIAGCNGNCGSYGCGG